MALRDPNHIQICDVRVSIWGFGDVEVMVEVIEGEVMVEIEEVGNCKGLENQG